MVNQGGKLLWVLDLSDLLNIPPSPKPSRLQDNLTLIVVSGSSNSTESAATQQVGCIVSAIKGIIPLDMAEFQPPSASISSDLKLFFSAMTAIEQSPVAVVNVKAVLAASKTSVTTTFWAD